MIGFFAQPDEDKQLEICDEHPPLPEGYDYDHCNREITYHNFMRETICSQLLDVELTKIFRETYNGSTS